MKFTDKKYPALAHIMKGDSVKKTQRLLPHYLAYEPEEAFLKVLHSDSYPKKVEYISHPVCKILDSQDFLEMLKDKLPEIFTPGHMGFMILAEEKLATIHYTISNAYNEVSLERKDSAVKRFKKNFPNETPLLEIICTFLGTGWVMGHLGAIVSKRKDGELGINIIPKTFKMGHKTYRDLVNKDKEANDILMYTNKIIWRIISTILFKKYADIEEVHLTPKVKKPKILAGTPVYNQSSFPVSSIDATWFRTVFVEGDFQVRGHFRCQPWGSGMKDRKIIWINKFTKHGYTRRAKKSPRVITPGGVFPQKIMSLTKLWDY